MAPKYNLRHVTKDYPFMTCIVKVNTGSSWQKTVGKVLNKCHGVYSFRMDDKGVVEISGTVDPELLLKMLGKAGKKAELHWFQFGECSSNLFMPMNYNNIGGGYYGGTSYPQHGRFLHAGNLPRPKPPSHEALRSSAYNTKPDYQIAYNHTHDYDQHAHHYHQHSYDHQHDYQHYDDYQYQYNYGNMYDVNQTHYRTSLQTSEDMGCCTVM